MGWRGARLVVSRDRIAVPRHVMDGIGVSRVGVASPDPWFVGRRRWQGRAAEKVGAPCTRCAFWPSAWSPARTGRCCYSRRPAGTIGYCRYGSARWRPMRSPWNSEASWPTPGRSSADRPRPGRIRASNRVLITEVRDNIFYAELILDRDTRVSARVSDEVALALHLGIPIHTEDTVLDTVGVRNTVT